MQCRLPLTRITIDREQQCPDVGILRLALGLLLKTLHQLGQGFALLEGIKQSQVTLGTMLLVPKYRCCYYRHGNNRHDQTSGSRRLQRTLNQAFRVFEQAAVEVEAILGIARDRKSVV